MPATNHLRNNYELMGENDPTYRKYFHFTFNLPSNCLDLFIMLPTNASCSWIQVHWLVLFRIKNEHKKINIINNLQLIFTNKLTTNPYHGQAVGENILMGKITKVVMTIKPSFCSNRDCTVMVWIRSTIQI